MKHELGVRKSRRQRKAAHNPKMDQNFFTYLPSAIIINILSRLPVRTTMSCKCVCKSWLDLLATPEFVKSHLSKSVPGPAVFLDANHPKPYKIFEFEDELNLNRRVRRWNIDLAFNFDLPCAAPLHSSANGLLFLCSGGVTPGDLSRIKIDYFTCSRNLFICNPITRDYIRLPCPQESSSSKAQLQLDTYGFGVSRMSGQYKLVRIFHGWIRVSERLAQSECQVYTVETESWRRIASGGPLKYEANAVGAFLNGNLHWLVRGIKGSSVWISCFDLETELFNLFSPPRPCDGECLNVSALRGCLCLCGNSAVDEIVIWLMKEYGGEKSWTKEFVIRKKYSTHVLGVLRPIKVFKNGDILMALEACTRLLYFTSKTKAIRKFDVFGLNGDFGILAIMYTPSFLPLKTFAMDNEFRKSRRQKKAAHNPKMGQDFFTYLAPEIIIDIISRLPIRTIMRCKCVCKSWLDLVKTREFVKLHLSKSVPGVPVFLKGAHSKPYKIVEFVDDELDLNCDEHRWNVVFNFNLPCREPLHSSANGLLFLCKQGLSRFKPDDVVWPRNLFICNPVTRDYITLPCPQESKYPLQLDSYGFGVSRMSGLYKLVRIFYEAPLTESECQVYTVGTGSWRRVASFGALNFQANAVGAFVNGNLHWLVRYKKGSGWISCFDIETELFSSVSPPNRIRNREKWHLSTLGDCLCLCSNSFGEESDNEIVIWLMKEYGDEKSWAKEFVIRKDHLSDFSHVVLFIKVFKNGDILMTVEGRRQLLYYSFKTKTFQEVDVSELDCIVRIRTIMYAPSFLPLKTFAMENVTSF